MLGVDRIDRQLADAFVRVRDRYSFQVVDGFVVQRPGDRYGEISSSDGAIDDGHLAGIDDVVAEIEM